MKPHNAKVNGATLLELTIAVGIIAMAGGLIFMVLNVGVQLYTKNTSINITHDQARLALMRLSQDVHQAVSVISTSGTPGGTTTYSATGQAISFQVVRGGPYTAYGSALQGASSIQVLVPPGGYLPLAGNRLVMPAFQVEADIATVTNPTAVTGGTAVTLNLLTTGTDSAVGLSSVATANGIGLGWAMTANGSVPYNFLCYITDRVTYLVSGTALGAWFGTVYPSGANGIAANKSYASLFGTNSNQMYYVFHATSSGTSALQANVIARGLINPVNLGQPATPFILTGSTPAFLIDPTSTMLTLSDVVTADLQHASSLKGGTNMTVNGTSVTGTALVFTALPNSVGMNMCITGGTLQILNSASIKQITNYP